MMKVMLSVLAGFMVAGAVYAKVAVTIEEEPAAKIEKIIIKKDHIELVSDGKTTVVNYDDVLKNKNIKPPVVVADNHPAGTSAKVVPAKEPETLDQAFAGNSERCVFKRIKSDLNRLKVAGQMKYKVFAEGDVLKTVKFNGKDYAKDSNGVVYETHWEVGKDFSKYLLTEANYFDKLSSQQKELKQSIAEKKRDMDAVEEQLALDRERQDKIKIQQAYIDNINDNNDYRNRNKNSSNVSNELVRLNKKIRKAEDNLRDLTKQKVNLQDALSSLQKFEADVRKKLAADQAQN
ncbi:MAG: hypothetical protein WC071_14110 [Victivallaceae bacterium]